MRRVVAVMIPLAVALVLCAALVTAGGGPRVATGVKAFLSGRSTLKVKGLITHKGFPTLRFDVADPTFTAKPPGGRPLAGTCQTDPKNQTKRTCTFDQGELAAWGLILADELSLAGNPPSVVTITKQTTKLTLGDSRKKKKLALTFSIEVSVNGGAALSGTFKMNGNAVPRRVLVLNDTEAGTQVENALRRAKHLPISGGNYYEWDGANPSLDDVEVVILLSGEIYSNPLLPAADAALAAFVQAGGGLVRTEWSAYQAGATPSQAVDALLPVRLPDSSAYAAGSTWMVTNPKHPLVKGLKKTFAVPDAGISNVQLVAGATVVAELVDVDGTFPAVTFAAAGAGTVVHVNHDMTYSTNVILPAILKVLVNSVSFLAP